MKWKPQICRAAAALMVALATPAAVAEPADRPKAVPASQAELADAFESLERREPRLPVLLDDDGQPISYLPAAWGGGDGLGALRPVSYRGGRDRTGAAADPFADSLFTDASFWVVSRGNNCHYCLGHQDDKLRASGLDDAALAALDGDWSAFEPRHRAVLSFARKLTLEPDRVDEADVAALEKHFSEPELIELAFTVAQFNALNRWTDAMGFPLEDYADRTASGSRTSQPGEASGQPPSLSTPETSARRLAAPSWDEVARGIEQSRRRRPRVELAGPDATAGKFGSAAAPGDISAWKRAFARLSPPAAVQAAAIDAVLNDDHLDPRLKAELAFVSAVLNRAWYSADLAGDRLSELGGSPEEIVAALADGGDEGEAQAGAAARQLAAKMTLTPHLVVDRDVAQVREHFSDAETAQIIYVVCIANLFDRFTSALGLPAE
jgi:alkylhydroperoxidase family enzyme